MLINVGKTGGIGGSGAVNPFNLNPFATAAFFAPLTSSLALTRGTGSATFTRATTATVVDFEGNVKLCKAGEARFSGARRVENLLINSTTCILTAQSGATNATVTQNTVQFTVVNGSYWIAKAAKSITIGMVLAGRITLLSAAAVTVRINLFEPNAQPGTGVNINLLAGIPQVVMLNRVCTTVSMEAYIAIDNRASQGASNTGLYSLTVTDFQVQDVTGQSVQTASEYVSSTENSTGALGVKYFETDYIGNPIPQATLKGYLAEPAATNLFLNSAVGVTQTTPALTAASYTLSFKGTGTITGTGGFVGTKTGTGVNDRVSLTVTATALAAGLTVTGSCTEVMFCALPYDTSYIPTGATAVTRNADTDTYPTAGNVGTTGTVYLEFTPTHAQSGVTYLWGCLVDVNNFTQMLVTNTSIILRKRVAGVNYDAMELLTVVSGVTYKIAVRFGTSGQQIAVNGVLGTATADSTAAAIAATMQVGTDGNGVGQPTTPNRKLYTWSDAKTDAQLVTITS